MLTLRRSLSRLFLALASGLCLTAIVLLGFLLTEAKSSVTTLPPASQVPAQPSTGLITASGRHLERDGEIFKVRGVNYYPKDYAWDRFWISYTQAVPQINAELDLARRLGVNTARLFVQYDLFDGTNQTHLDHLKDLVDRLHARDMVAIVTLFDLYASPPYSDHLASRRHISAVVNTLGVTHPAVLAWDVKNEIDRDYARFGKSKVKAWATEMISYTRQVDPHHLVTLGFYGVVSNTGTYSPAIAAAFAPQVDFVSMHYFLPEGDFENDLQALQAQIGAKPLVLEEFGLHTLSSPTITCTAHPTHTLCDDPHTEAEQAAYYNALLSLGQAYDTAGVLFWTLNDFSHILSGTQESHHCQGIVRNSLVDNCQVTSTLDYAPKPAAATICRHYETRGAYLDLFDGWVTPATDAPPPGWSDNWSGGGALLRGYNPSNPLWSQHPGQVAFSKFVAGSISITGLASSPVLTRVNVDLYPILAGQVYSYSVRDPLNGSDAILHIGVQEGTHITRLLTIQPGAPVPAHFRLDLRRPPLNWRGSHNFRIVFELLPQGPENGYSATYEFDWIGLQSAFRDAITAPLAIPFSLRDTFGPRLLQPESHSRYDFHRGVDWPAPEGTPVYAVTTGTVRAFRDDWVSGVGSGNFVHLEHAHLGYETRYNHLWGVPCAITDELQVLPGQLIGWVGDTGARYPHLHFEVRRGLNVSQRAAIHPLSTPFLPWTNATSPTVTLRGVYTDATGLTALVEVSSPHPEPDVAAVGVTVSGAVTDGRSINFAGLNASTTVVADLDDPLVNDVCIFPADLNATHGYRATLAFRQLGYGATATATAQASDVQGGSGSAARSPGGNLQVTPPQQSAEGVPGQTVTLVYTLTNHGAGDTFTLTHLSAQGWPSTVTPPTITLPLGGVPLTVSVEITLNTDRFGPPDCGLLVAQAHDDAGRVVGGFYRLHRDAHASAATGSDASGTGGAQAPFETIRHAIGQTDAGGSVRVAQGTYTENLTLTRTVHLLGGYAVDDWTARALAAFSTTVDGAGAGPALVIDGDYGPLVEGFTFVRGHNRSGAGGGVRLVGGAAPTLRANWILSNTAARSGGGVYVGSYGTLTPTIVNNVIAGNIASSSLGGGGGIYVSERPALIQGNVISGNRATVNDGGGLYLTGDTAAQALGNHILGNAAAWDGGGALIRSSNAAFANNVVRHNTAAGNGAGVRVGGPSDPRLCNNTLLANAPSGGVGLFIGAGSSPLVRNNVIARHAVGVRYDGSATRTIYFNVLSNTLDYGGNVSGPNDVLADPRLSDEVHLAFGSPAIDAGEMAACVPATDLDGIRRPRDGDCDNFAVVDVGAAEYFGCLYLPLVLKSSGP